MQKLIPGLVLFPLLSFLLVAEPVSVKDFKPAFGNWKGSLTYLDYSSGKPYTMPANITISRNKLNEQQLILAFQYPDEPKANENDTLVISPDGSSINAAPVVSKQRPRAGLWEIVTEERGTDGNENRTAILKHIYRVSKKEFTIRKEVKFEGAQQFILRNEYTMTR